MARNSVSGFAELSFFIFLTLAFFVAAKRVELRPDYLKFVFNATDFPTQDYYDYIVVGGGTSGCALAATLSANYRVLVLERGGLPYGNSNLMTEDGFLTTLTETDHAESPVEAFVSDDGVPNARGRVLGGSSAINAGFYSRADTDFFKKSGIEWNLRLVNESYEWVERAIVFRPVLKNWQSSIRNGLLESGVGPYNGFSLDHMKGTKIGGSTFDESGRRHSSADLLNHAKPKNIRVAINALVERVLLASSSAIGVVYQDGRRRLHRALLRERGEVLLTAGAIGSPQLLFLSGIGHGNYLSSWGIPVYRHLPHVGEFLFDNPRNGISIVPPSPLEHSLIQVVGITDSGCYFEAASNVLPFSFPSSPFLRTGIVTAQSPLFLTVATIMEKITGPVSTGYLRLSSTDARSNPFVRFNYFSSSIDLDRCVSGMRKIGEVLGSRSMEDFKFRDWLGRGEFRFVGPDFPDDRSDNASMADFCRRTMSTIWHYHGGCVVGKVVDRKFRVLGVDALRVVDGSTFVVSPGTNPQATVMMLGRYMGLKLLQARTSRPI